MYLEIMLFLCCCFNRDNIGYPIAECAADGKFILSKPPNTGGLVSPSTVAEQVRVKVLLSMYIAYFHFTVEPLLMAKGSAPV